MDRCLCAALGDCAGVQGMGPACPWGALSSGEGLQVEMCL